MTSMKAQPKDVPVTVKHVRQVIGDERGPEFKPGDLYLIDDEGRVRSVIIRPVD